VSPFTQGGREAVCVSVGVMYVTVREADSSMVVPSTTRQSGDAPVQVDIEILPKTRGWDGAVVIDCPLASEITEEKKSSIRGSLNVFDEILFWFGAEVVFCDAIGEHPIETLFADNEIIQQVSINIIDVLMLLDEPLLLVVIGAELLDDAEVPVSEEDGGNVVVALTTVTVVRGTDEV
jgi:hypothetical protein